MSDGYVSSPNQPEIPDSKVRFSTQSREEVSLYGTPKEEMGPVNSSRLVLFIVCAVVEQHWTFSV